MSGFIVEMNHITKRFPGIVANDDVSIQIRKGEIYALLGENGAGKSTLMSMLFGLYEPDGGEIVVRGRPVRMRSPNDATDLGIGMVHQHFKLIEPFTVAENVVLGIEQNRRIGRLATPFLDMRAASDRIRRISKEYGLEVNPDDRIEDLTVCMRQRVEIFKMLYRNAEILIFDEPTSVLTPQEIETLLGILRSLRAAGKTIVLISHKLEEIKLVADRCAILRGGRLVSVVETVGTTTQQMANMMVGRNVIFTVRKDEPRFGRRVLEVEGLTASDDEGVQCVRDVSFSIREGEIFAIAGVSGNGQMETAEIIAGLMRSSSGRISLLGEDITGLSVKERIERGICYVPEDRQNVGLILDETLADNIVIKQIGKRPFSRRGVLDEGEIGAYADRVIRKYDVRTGQGAATVARSMSGGNQQKAVIGRELELSGKLMIFVQPTRGLDVGAIENIWKLIIQERDKGRAVLLISLELEEIMNLADTIGVIFNGHIGKIAPRSEMDEREVGAYMMGVRK